jgi:hypothetical protein
MPRGTAPCGQEALPPPLPSPTRSSSSSSRMLVRFTTAEVCFMDAPPPNLLVPVASSSPPSPLTSPCSGEARRGGTGRASPSEGAANMGTCCPLLAVPHSRAIRSAEAHAGPAPASPRPPPRPYLHGGRPDLAVAVLVQHHAQGAVQVGRQLAHKAAHRLRAVVLRHRRLAGVQLHEVEGAGLVVVLGGGKQQGRVGLEWRRSCWPGCHQHACAVERLLGATPGVLPATHAPSCLGKLVRQHAAAAVDDAPLRPFRDASAQLRHRRLIALLGLQGLVAQHLLALLHFDRGRDQQPATAPRAAAVSVATWCCRPVHRRCHRPRPGSGRCGRAPGHDASLQACGAW